MPQPVSKVLKSPPPTGVSISTQPGNAAMQPELAVLVAQAISIWSLVECTMGQILVDILGAKALPAVAMYSSLFSSSAQVAALKAAASVELNKEHDELLQAILKMYSSDVKQRNKFAHWVWAYSEQLPHHLILIDPVRNVQGHTVVSELIHHGKSTNLSELKFKIPWSDEWFCYSKAELQQIVEQFGDLLNLFRWFQALVGPRPFPQIKHQAYSFLSTHSRLQTALSHLRRGQRSDGLEPEYNI